MEKNYEQYALLDATIKDLENKKDALKVEILKSMVENKEEKINTNVGTFSVTKLKKWLYPVEVMNLESDFKIAKSNAELKGTATFTESESLRFNSLKIK